jgi:hypothetical protein
VTYVPRTADSTVPASCQPFAGSDGALASRT